MIPRKALVGFAIFVVIALLSSFAATNFFLNHGASDSPSSTRTSTSTTTVTSISSSAFTFSKTYSVTTSNPSVSSSSFDNSSSSFSDTTPACFPTPVFCWGVTAENYQPTRSPIDGLRMSVYVVDLAPYSSRGSIYVFERMTTGLYFGEIGYASSNGSSDVGYARVWNASSDAELAYQTFPVALGNQTFSIILDTNSPTDSWNFSVGDSTQFVYSMATSIPTSQTFTGVEESGGKSFIFPNIGFSNAILTLDSSGVWAPPVDGYAVLSNYPGSNIAGVEGHAQDPLIRPDQALVGGYLPDPAGNSNGLW